MRRYIVIKSFYPIFFYKKKQHVRTFGPGIMLFMRWFCGRSFIYLPSSGTVFPSDLSHVNNWSAKGPAIFEFFFNTLLIHVGNRQ